MEWLNDGQHIEKYAIEAWEDNEMEDRSIGPGHWAMKKIDALRQ